jgi:superfamily II DNA or RNA helicase
MIPVAGPDSAANDLQPKGPLEPMGSPFQALITQWLDRTDSQTKAAPRVHERSRELLYLLQVDDDHRVAPSLGIALRQLRKNATGALKRVSGDLWRLIADQPSYVTAEDREILESLALIRAQYPHASQELWTLAGPRATDTLQSLLATGRLALDLNGEAIATPGPPRSVRLGWQRSADSQLMQVGECDPPARLLVLQPPYYADYVTGSVGVAEPDMPVDAFLQALSNPVPLAVTPDGNAASPIDADAMTAPRGLGSRAIRGVLPIARLVFTSEQWEPQDPARSWRQPREWIDYARLVFEYAGVRLDASDEAVTRVVTEQWITIVTRDLAAEAKLLATLRASGLQPARDIRTELAHDASLSDVWTQVDREGWIDFLTHGAPHLEDAGFQLEFEPHFRFRLSAVDAIVGDILPAADGSDWFAIDLHIVVEGERHPLIPLIMALLEQNRDLFTREGLERLRDGRAIVIPLGDRYVSLPAKRIEGLLRTLIEMQERIADGETSLRLNRMDAARLADVEAQAGVTWQAPKALLTLARELRRRESMEVIQPPTGLTVSLRPYQQDGVNWLQFLRRASLAGILADDMGLGKTVQALAHVLIEKESGRLNQPALIVAPTSLVHNWESEAAKFAPSLRVLALHGLSRREKFADIAAHDLVITTYPLLVRDRDVLAKQRFHIAILDEAQFIKNASTQAARVTRDLKVRHRLCLTGTPLENHLGELWSQFNFLAPGLLGDARAFAKTYRTPIEKHGDADRLSQLNQRLSALILRRTKEQVANELPAKTEILRMVELLPEQRDFYDAIRLATAARVREAIAERGIAQSQIVILDALLKLRQACCDPRLVKLESAERTQASAKLELLMTLLPELHDEGRRVLIFSQFTSMLALIERELIKAGIAYVTLTGDTKDRAAPVKRFQSGEVPVFLISLKAGGTGLNLTAADTVIHYDPWWNPAAENQATDRAHRIGQNKPVFVYKLVAIGTVEERIMALQQRKAALAASLLGDSEARGVAMTEADIEALFGGQ